MKRIGIFGGTFDPVQIAHLIIAERFIEEINLDKCIFVPANVSPFKSDMQSKSMENMHRTKMLRLAIKNNPKYQIDEFEINRGGISHTINTVKYLKEKYPNTDLYLLIGSDHCQSFYKWDSWTEILEQVQLVIALRPNTLLPEDIDIINKKLKVGIKIPLWLDAPILDISATEIRLRVSMGKSIKYIVPRKVEKYILKNKLYISNKD